MGGHDWQLTGWYLLVLCCLAFPMKLLSLRRFTPEGKGALLSFFLAPSLCGRSWARRHSVRGMERQLLAKGLGFLVLYGLVVYCRMYIPADLGTWWLQGYLAIVPFWLMLEALEVMLQLLWLPTGSLVPAINDRPYLSGSLTEFWGRRWNRMFGDWLAQVCFQPLQRSPLLGLGLTFVLSGCIHELLVSLPYVLVYGKSLWGMMTGYFLIQYAGVVAERRWLKSRPVLRRLFCWLIVLVPAPLILNPGTLGVFHMVRM